PRGVVAEPPRLPDWLVAEVAGWPQDAFGAHQTRRLRRDASVIAPVAILPSGDIVGWGQAGEAQFDADDIVAIERIDDSLGQLGVRGGNLAGEGGVLDDQLFVHLDRAPVALLVQIGEDERRQSLPAGATLGRLLDSLLDERLDVQALVGRPGEHDPGVAAK